MDVRFVSALATDPTFRQCCSPGSEYRAARRAVAVLKQATSPEPGFDSPSAQPVPHGDVAPRSTEAVEPCPWAVGGETHVAFWDAVNRYVESCGGDPDKGWSSTHRMSAVVDIEAIVASVVRSRPARSMATPIEWQEWNTAGGALRLAVERAQEFLDGLGLDADDAEVREQLRRAVADADKAAAKCQPTAHVAGGGETDIEFLQDENRRLVERVSGLLNVRKLYLSQRDEARAELEKWRGAASQLCGAHVGVKQERCPACERDELRSSPRPPASASSAVGEAIREAISNGYDAEAVMSCVMGTANKDLQLKAHTQLIRKQRGRDYAAAIDEATNVKGAMVLYREALRTYGPDGVDWRQVNGAILNRWSGSTLEKIKREAWRKDKTP